LENKNLLGTSLTIRPSCSWQKWALITPGSLFFQTRKKRNIMIELLIAAVAGRTFFLFTFPGQKGKNQSPKPAIQAGRK